VEKQKKSHIPRGDTAAAAASPLQCCQVLCAWRANAALSRLTFARRRRRTDFQPHIGAGPDLRRFGAASETLARIIKFQPREPTIISANAISVGRKTRKAATPRQKHHFGAKQIGPEVVLTRNN
jgi:hypothetical protein